LLSQQRAFLDDQRDLLQRYKEALDSKLGGIPAGSQHQKQNRPNIVGKKRNNKRSRD
jgi:hypothetical protein